MDNSVKQLENYLRTIAVTTRPETDDRILSAALARYDRKMQMHGVDTSLDRRRLSFWRQPRVRAVVAASLAAVVTLGLILATRPADSTTALMERIASIMQSPQWVEVHYREQVGDQVAERRKWINYQKQKVLTTTQDGSAWCFDYKNQLQYNYDPESNIVLISNLPRSSSFLPTSSSNALHLILENYHPRRSYISQRQRQESRDGRLFKVFEVTQAANEGNKADAVVTKHTLVVDAKSSKLVSGQTSFVDEQGDVTGAVAMSLNYAEKGPESIYELHVPENATVIDTTGTIAAHEPVFDSTPEEYLRKEKPRDEIKTPEKVELTTLDIEYPRQHFEYLPQYLIDEVHNLQPLRVGRRAPFYAPRGTEVVSDRKPVVVSGTLKSGAISMIVDGDRDSGKGAYVELGNGLQSITIDLQDAYEIYALTIWHYHMQPRVYYDVIVQFADDAGFTRNVQTVFNNDDDNSAGFGFGNELNYVETYEGKLIDCGGRTARYIRLYSNGNNENDLNHYCEVEVYGLPAE